jgi:hypothetical protein
MARVFFIKYGQGGERNAHRTLAKDVQIDGLIPKIDGEAEVQKQLKGYAGRGLRFWAFRHEPEEEFRTGDVLLIVLTSTKTLFYCEIVGLISDPAGVIGDAIGWSRMYGRPWTRVLLLTACDISGLFDAVASLTDNLKFGWLP